MDVCILVVIGASLVAVNSQPVPDGTQNFVPGLFISADTLKDLQAKAQQNQITENQPLTNSNRQGDQTSANADQQLKLSMPYQTNSSPQNSPNNGQNQQSILANQPILPNSQTMGNQQILASTQPLGNQQILANPQPLPNQQILANPQPLPNQPGMIPNQPQIIPLQGTQMNQQPILVARQPNQPQILVNPQPGFSQQPILVSQQPGNQLYMNQQPNQVILQNGQIAQLVPNPGNQVTLMQGSRQLNPQNPGTLYAMVPVNGPNNMQTPNTNLGNGNTYLVPVQQVPSNQIYSING